MQIAEIMTSKIEWVSPDTTLQEAARKMRDLDIGSLTVMEDGELVGMITDRDICCRGVADGQNPAKTKVRDIMSKDVTTCFSDQDITDAAHLMEGKHIRRLAVLNRERKTVGFLSVDDLACYSHDLAGEVLEASATAH